MKTKSIIAFTFAMLALSIPTAFAAFPEKPVTLIVGFAEGDGGDALGRAIATKLEEELQGNLIVENIGGSGGAVAAATLAKRRPDGHTIGMILSFATSFIPLTGKVDYTPDSFTYLGTASEAGSVFLARTDHGYTDFPGLINKAKNDGYLTYGSLTPIDRMIMQSIARAENFELDIIPAKGGGPLRAALVAGDTEAVLGGASGLKLAAANDDIAALATFNETKLENAPNVPTLSDLGYAGLSSNTYFLLLGPRGIPSQTAQQLSAAIQSTVNSAEIKALIRRLGSRPITLSGKETEALAERQVQAYQQLIDNTQ